MTRKRSASAAEQAAADAASGGATRGGLTVEQHRAAAAKYAGVSFVESFYRNKSHKRFYRATIARPDGAEAGPPRRRARGVRALLRGCSRIFLGPRSSPPVRGCFLRCVRRMQVSGDAPHGGGGCKCLVRERRAAELVRTQSNEREGPKMHAAADWLCLRRFPSFARRSSSSLSEEGRGGAPVSSSPLRADCVVGAPPRAAVLIILLTAASCRSAARPCIFAAALLFRLAPPLAAGTRRRASSASRR